MYGNDRNGQTLKVNNRGYIKISNWKYLKQGNSTR